MLEGGEQALGLQGASLGRARGGFHRTSESGLPQETSGLTPAVQVLQHAEVQDSAGLE